jgi:F-type H+-transporting ATPase subunit epsilon
MAFTCTVLTPETQVLSQSVSQAIVPAHDGLLGILTDRAPAIVKLVPGPLRIDSVDGASQYFFIDGGIGQMKDNNLTILTSRAVPASQVDAAAAQRDFEEAMRITGTDPASIEKREQALQRARAKQAVARA